ncbi:MULTISPECIES: flagellin N-terminal helical domain-containing protein [unclassified Sporolactobacillus]|uniref:flagellin N-terminal helical domain-containing protein n=1 Tax=unclassified Sporolactobacillus TaxID=2628533 RepID=UPI002367EDA6|nr:flagellin [Sporolactobacillus sp. CQH2019]MDD9148068.1 flagellin [Sporolactobacillus sp. CQH2019]
MIINDNIPALNTLNQLTKNNNAVNKSLQRLSSGLRINSAADDPAGLAISQKMQGQINGLNQASQNAQDANSLIQTADGSLSETQSILQNMRELAVQAGNDTNTAADRQQLQQEINQYTSEINGIANSTQFNTQNLLNGSQDASAGVSGVETFKLLSNITAGQTVQIGNQTFTAVANASGITSSGTQFVAGSGASGLAVAIGKNAALSGEYSAAAASGKLTLSQKTANTLMVSIDGTGIDANSVQTTTQGVSSGNGKSLVFQIGANQNQTLSLNIGDMSATALGIASTSAGANGNGFATAADITNGTDNTGIQYGLDITTASGAAQAVTTIQSAIDMVSSQRAVLGAYQNRLDSTVNNLTTSSQNLTSAKSGITDVDMASEMANFTKESILSQAANSMLAQANQLPQSVLKLLG